jgi:hypothetical protein
MSKKNFPKVCLMSGCLMELDIVFVGRQLSKVPDCELSNKTDSGSPQHIIAPPLCP